jgi:hypothetical protein
VFKTIQITFIGLTAALLLTACGPSEQEKLKVKNQAEIENIIKANFISDKPIASELLAYSKEKNLSPADVKLMLDDIADNLMGPAGQEKAKNLPDYLRLKKIAEQDGYLTISQKSRGDLYKYPSGKDFNDYLNLIGNKLLASSPYKQTMSYDSYALLKEYVTKNPSEKDALVELYISNQNERRAKDAQCGQLRIGERIQNLMNGGRLATPYLPMGIDITMHNTRGYKLQNENPYGYIEKVGDASYNNKPAIICVQKVTLDYKKTDYEYSTFLIYYLIDPSDKDNFYGVNTIFESDKADKERSYTKEYQVKNLVGSDSDLVRLTIAGMKK